eukprot:3101735-Pyramimonas_sp.AAC.1
MDRSLLRRLYCPAKSFIGETLVLRPPIVDQTKKLTFLRDDEAFASRPDISECRLQLYTKHATGQAKVSTS